MEIGRSKFYDQQSATMIFNGLFHAYKGFFQVRFVCVDGSCGVGYAGRITTDVSPCPFPLSDLLITRPTI